MRHKKPKTRYRLHKESAAQRAARRADAKIVFEGCMVFLSLLFILLFYLLVGSIE